MTVKRFYFANDGLGGYPSPVFGDSIPTGSGGKIYCPLTTVKHAGHTLDAGRAQINSPGPNPAAVITDISAQDVLPVGTISGSWEYILRSDFYLASGAQPYMRLLITSGDGATLRGVMFAGSIACPSGDRISRLSGSLAPVSVQAGDRFVIERGDVWGTVGSFNSLGYYYDNHDAALSDYTVAQVGTSPGPNSGIPWIELTYQVSAFKMYVGANKVDKLYVGSSSSSKAYLGTTQV